jgi:hypothetical protein
MWVYLLRIKQLDFEGYSSISFAAKVDCACLSNSAFLTSMCGRNMDTLYIFNETEQARSDESN